VNRRVCAKLKHIEAGGAIQNRFSVALGGCQPGFAVLSPTFFAARTNECPFDANRCVIAGLKSRFKTGCGRNCCPPSKMDDLIIMVSRHISDCGRRPAGLV
jgi:hypothetical protein